jgi:hypothetical protein
MAYEAFPPSLELPLIQLVEVDLLLYVQIRLEQRLVLFKMALRKGSCLVWQRDGARRALAVLLATVIIAPRRSRPGLVF